VQGRSAPADRFASGGGRRAPIHTSRYRTYKEQPLPMPSRIKAGMQTLSAPAGFDKGREARARKEGRPTAQAQTKRKRVRKAEAERELFP
jgi:hypothetical protein